jgi:tetratricopeptide (TPR) repeat protein
MSTQRRAASAAGFLALSLAAAGPLLGQSQQPQQRGGPPKAETPYILITTFHSSDRELGSKLADELRKRVSQEHSASELFVVQKKAIDGTLEASGYRPDSALSSSDLMELAKQLRGEEVIDGTVDKSATGVKVNARMLVRSGQATVAQPLPPLDVKDVGEAAKQIERQITEVNKARGDYNACKNSAIAGKYPEAAAAAAKGVAAYPQSVFNRVCLLGVLTATKAGPDTVIAVASAIKTLDPTSLIALANLADAYMTKGDTAHAIETQIALYRADPTNTPLIRSIIATLAQSGAPDRAIPMIDTLLVNNPGDPEMLRTKWLLFLRARQFKQAIAAGEEYVKAVPDSATVDYFNRQIGAAQSDSNTTLVQDLAARAAAKFPKSADFNLLIAQGQLKAGQVQQAIASAQKAIAADPKDARGYMLALAGFNQLGQGDSAIAVAQKAIAAGVSKDDIGTQLAAIIQPALKKAQETKAREDWEATLKAAQTADQIAPSAFSSFVMGVSAFYIGTDLMGHVQTLVKGGKKADQAQACTEVKQAEDMFATTSMSMPKGGSIDKNTAGQVLNAVGQYGEYIAAVKKATCK